MAESSCLSVKHRFIVFVALLIGFGVLLAATVVVTLSPLSEVFDSYVDENSQRTALVTRIQSEFGFGSVVYADTGWSVMTPLG